MSKRAEEAALKAYPELLSGSNFGPLPVDLNKSCRDKYQEGYEQAEKDLALTWKDVMEICEIGYFFEDDIVENDNTDYSDDEPFYKEVLRRFNECRKKEWAIVVSIVYTGTHWMVIMMDYVWT